MNPGRVFEVKDDKCVACNLCVNICPVEGCISMLPMTPRRDRPAHRPGGIARLCKLGAHANNPIAKAVQ